MSIENVAKKFNDPIGVEHHKHKQLHSYGMRIL